MASTACDGTPKRTFRSKSLMITLSILLVQLIFGVTLLTILLATDVLTIPYLTPIAHFLANILAPFVPLLAPLTLGLFLKVCQHETFPSKKNWVVISGVWLCNNLLRVWNDTAGLYLGRGDDGRVQLCGLNDCKAAWIQALLIGVVVVGQCTGLKWDFGFFDKWIEALVRGAKAEEERKRQKALSEDAENGTIDKRALITVHETLHGDVEKNAVLVDVDQKGCIEE